MKNQQQQLSVLSLSLLSFILLSLNTFAQRDYRWDKEYKESPAIPPEFQTEDAVIIYNKEERQTLVQNNEPYTRDIIKRRYKILTQAGLDNYTRFTVPKRYDMSIRILDARTRKADGSIVDLEASEIKELSYNEELDLNDKDKYMRFAVPGVEVGDEVEIVVTWEGNTLHSGDNIFPHLTLPVMRSEFELYIDQRIIVFTAPVNGMPEPKVKQVNDHFRFTWINKNLPGLFDETGSIPGKTLPNLIYEYDYSLFQGNNRPDPKEDWRDLVKEIQEYLELRKNLKKFDAIMQGILGDSKDAPIAEQARIIHDYLNDNITVKRLSESEKSGTIETYFTRKTADWTALLSMYDAAFKWIGANYYLGTGRSKYLGDLILEFPTDYQVTDYFYLIEDEQGGVHLYPPKTRRRTWEADEIPLHLRGTDVYMLNVKDKTSLKQLTFSNEPYNKNQMLYKGKIEVNLAEGSMKYQVQETYAGEVSTYYRDKMYEVEEEGKLQENLTKSLSEEIPNIVISNAKMSNYPKQSPFKFSMSYEANTPDQISEIESNVYKINVGNRLSHSTVDVPQRKRALDYYPRYAFMEAYNYYVSLTENAALQNKDNLTIKVENEVGSYELSVNQIKPNALSVRSRYTIKMNSIPADKIHLLAELNEAAESAVSTELILAKE